MRSCEAASFSTHVVWLCRVGIRVAVVVLWCACMRSCEAASFSTHLVWLCRPVEEVWLGSMAAAARYCAAAVVTRRAKQHGHGLRAMPLRPPSDFFAARIHPPRQALRGLSARAPGGPHKKVGTPPSAEQPVVRVS